MSAKLNGSGDPKIASLEDARRKAAAKAKAERRAASGRQPRTMRDLVVGGAIIAMAVGFLVSLAVPLVKG